MLRRLAPSLAAALALSALLAGCAGAPPKAAPPPLPAAKAASVSPRRRTELDQKFYMAVTAYVQGDYADARGLLTEILRADPTDKDALSLRRRVLAAQKVAAP